MLSLQQACQAHRVLKLTMHCRHHGLTLACCRAEAAGSMCSRLTMARRMSRCKLQSMPLHCSSIEALHHTCQGHPELLPLGSKGQGAAPQPVTALFHVMVISSGPLAVHLQELEVERMPAGCTVRFVGGREPLRTGCLLSVPAGQHRCSLRWCPSRPGSMRGTLVLLWRGHCRLQVGPPDVCFADLGQPFLYVAALSCCASQRMVQIRVSGFFSVKPAASAGVRPDVGSHVDPMSVHRSWCQALPLQAGAAVLQQQKLLPAQYPWAGQAACQS